MLLPGTLLHGKYRVLTIVGGGGFGTVFRGEMDGSAGDPIPIAIKEMRRLLPTSRLQKRDAREVTAVPAEQTSEFDTALWLFE
jgi:hypothetical protein